MMMRVMCLGLAIFALSTPHGMPPLVPIRSNRTLEKELIGDFQKRLASAGRPSAQPFIVIQL